MKFFIDTANIDENKEAAELGADVATIPFAVINKLFNHPLTDSGLDKLLSDWKTLSEG